MSKETDTDRVRVVPDRAAFKATTDDDVGATISAVVGEVGEDEHPPKAKTPMLRTKGERRRFMRTSVENGRAGVPQRL
jgi:hypothetical protein